MTDFSGDTRTYQGACVKEYLENLRTAAWRTAGARYNAARRLRRRELFSVSSLAFFSALSIALAYLQRIFSPVTGSPLDNYLAALSMILGVCLLVISLVEWGSAHGAKADALHRSAEELTGFRRKVELAVSAESDSADLYEKANALRAEYEEIKARCSPNHLPIDNDLFSTSQRKAKEFQDENGKPLFSAPWAFWVYLRWQWSSLWFFLSAWTVVLGLLGGIKCFI